jgi:hypothetical protein
VTSGLTLRKTLVAQREAQQALVDALAETHRLADARYRAGIDSYLVVDRRDPTRRPSSCTGNTLTHVRPGQEA